MHHLYAVGLDGFIPFYSFFPLNLYKANRARVASATSSADIKDTNHVKVILFGSILGDGQLEMPPRGKNARSNNIVFYRQLNNLVIKRPRPLGRT